jgi:hypothetical protein
MAMTLTCSLFGHDFGEAEVVREREEDGSEVIITVREIKHCSRCSAERVVSENKEVTTVETPSDIVGEELNADPEDGAADAGADAGADTDAESTDTPASAGVSGGEPAEPAATADGTDDAGGADGADGATATGAGDAGAASDGEAESATVPDAEGVPPGSRDPEEDDGIILDDEEESERETRALGEWPEEEEDEEDWAPEIDPEADTDADSSADAEPETVEATSEVLTVPEGTFHCPECAFSTPVEDSSLRAGDFCPECHRGTLEHRAE